MFEFSLATTSPKLARDSQRKKMINKFWEYLCDSKLQRMKLFSIGAFWMAGGTHADKSTEFADHFFPLSYPCQLG